MELATQDEKIRAKTQEMMDRSVRYIESALVDAKRLELVSVIDLSDAAQRVYSMTLGMLLNAKIRNDLKVLQALETSIMDIIGANVLAA
jgi:TetR/AcrR family transcriptional repressor of nem operon